MNSPHLDKKIMGSMGKQGELAPGTGGKDGKDGSVSSEITGRNVMANPKPLDKMESKPSSANPGFDGKFWAKGNPQDDTTGHGRLTRGDK